MARIRLHRAAWAAGLLAVGLTGGSSESVHALQQPDWWYASVRSPAVGPQSTTTEEIWMSDARAVSWRRVTDARIRAHATRPTPDVPLRDQFRLAITRHLPRQQAAPDAAVDAPVPETVTLAYGRGMTTIWWSGPSAAIDASDLEGVRAMLAWIRASATLPPEGAQWIQARPLTGALATIATRGVVVPADTLSPDAVRAVESPFFWVPVSDTGEPPPPGLTPANPRAVVASRDGHLFELLLSHAEKPMSPRERDHR